MARCEVSVETMLEEAGRKKRRDASKGAWRRGKCRSGVVCSCVRDESSWGLDSLGAVEADGDHWATELGA